MPRFVAGGAQDAISQFLIQRELENRQRMHDELMQEREAAENEDRKRAIGLREREFNAQQERQQRADALADADRQRAQSDAANAKGMQLFTADAIRQPGILDNRDTARALAADLYGETGMVPGIVDKAMEPPNRTVVSTVDDKGRKVRRAVTDEDLAAGVLEYEQPGSDASFTLGPGDVRYDARGNVIARGRPRADAEGTDDPSLPRGVQDYLASMKGRGYSRDQAEAEMFNADTWNKIRTAHPRVRAVDVQQALGRFFPDNDLLGGGGADASTDRGGVNDTQAADDADEPRTATSADVARVAQGMNISPADARRRLAAQGVRIQD